VQYQGIYPGVDLVYYGNEGQLEYDFIVAPGADPKVISLAVDSTSYKQGSSRRLAPRLDANGDLVLGKEGREIRFHHPVVYQEFEGEKRVRDGRYEVRGNGLISFVVGSYDTKKPLIIDPVLTFSTFLGGASFDRVLGVAVDSSRNIYVTGETNSADFPTAGGVSPNSLASSGTTCGADTCPDVFVTKLDPTGTNLIYSTYIGGDGVDGGEGIAVDGSGNAHITGHTTSSDFPHSGNAYQQSPFLGQSCVDPVSQQAIQCDDAIVVKLNPAGNLLLYSSYFGSVGEETGHAIAINSAGMIFITGYVGSNTFPKTSSAYQTAPGGGTCGVAPSTYNCGDAFVAKFNPALSGTASLIYSTYLGGNGDDYGYGIAVDSSGNAYVTGLTLKNPSQAEISPQKEPTSQLSAESRTPSSPSLTAPERPSCIPRIWAEANRMTPMGLRWIPSGACMSQARRCPVTFPPRPAPSKPPRPPVAPLAEVGLATTSTSPSSIPRKPVRFPWFTRPTLVGLTTTSAERSPWIPRGMPM
jgi:hypothetical protein